MIQVFLLVKATFSIWNTTLLNFSTALLYFENTRRYLTSCIMEI